MSTPKKQSIIVTELKQLTGFLAAVRTQNNTINQELAGMVRKVAKLREAQLGIDLLLTEFEKKLR